MAKRKGALVDCFVEGRPHVPRGSGGPRDSSGTWSIQVIDETLRFSPIKGPCELDVEFVLPADTDSWELPWEMTLDHLTMHLLEALEMTFLGRGELAEGSLVLIRARKRIARRGQRTGVHVVVTKARGRARSPRRSG
ncbi:MAG: hypothetical protein WB809_00530 [Thermoplasmata archaeon]